MAAVNETRQAKRRRTNNAGIIRIGDKEFPILLRDASQTGARVRLVKPCDLPDQVTIVCAMEKIDKPCVVVWRRGNDIGVRFETPLSAK
ncbi:MAG: PilZ domain-containing protein [Rhizobiales bacterium]|nr:PilZ domain-containing protein [Hyphomicrobiales bacterium]